MRRVAVLAFGAVLAAGCGEDGPDPPPAAVTIPSTTTAPGRTFSDEMITGDGHRYRVTLTVGEHTVSAEGCPSSAPVPPGPGVTVTVANQASDRAAPFPPLRVELVGESDASPRPIPVRDPTGGCSFAPRLAPIPGGASVVLRGVAPDGPGRVEVNLSESRFSLVAPVG